jgi:hypothetical protein
VFERVVPAATIAPMPPEDSSANRSRPQHKAYSVAAGLRPCSQIQKVFFDLLNKFTGLIECFCGFFRVNLVA